MHHTEISILIPTYNRPGYLLECLESCLVQDLFATQNIEIIITDNSDNDDTAKALEPYLTKHHYIRYQKNSTNLGMTGNWNECLTLATGKYIIFLSDDDKLYDAQSLSILYDYLIAHPHIGAVSGKKVIIDDHGHVIPDMEYIVKEDEVILRPVDFIKANVIGFG